MERDGEKEQCFILLTLEIKANPSHISPAQLLCDRVHIFLGRADFDIFVRFGNTASYLMLDDMLALANYSVCLLACVVAF